MTAPLVAPPLPAPRRWRRLGDISAEGRPSVSWSSALPSASEDALRLRIFSRRLRRRLAALPADLPARLAQALGEVFPIEHRPRPRLGSVLVHPDGERRALTLVRPRTVFGRDPGCDVRLPSPAVAARQCEVRLTPRGATLLALAPGLSLDGAPVDSDRLRPLPAGAVLDLPPYRLLVGALGGEVETAKASVRVSGVAPWLGAEPLGALAPGCDWLQITSGDWRGVVAVPVAWLDLAAEVFGLDDPAEKGSDGRSGGRPDGVDRSLLGYLASEVARRVTELVGVDGRVAGPFAAPQAEQLLELDDPPRSGPRSGTWAMARVDTALGGTDAETAVVWREDAASPGPPGLDDLEIPVAVDLGHTRLAAADLDALAPGDAILPDRWPSGTWPAPSVEGLPEAPEAPPGNDAVGLRIAAAAGPRRASAVLQRDGDALVLDIASPWAPEAPELMEGDSMESPRTETTGTEPTGNETSVVQASEAAIGDGVEVTLGFELERLHVPIGELRTWREGETIRLDRGPDDPIRLVLRQRGGDRLLGQGRVVVVDGRLAVVVESWGAAP
ncbi:MAG: FliM/FliN family flagellar motor switch protein [Acidobacteriota bacterium]